ncbi:MAG TPA: DNA mismatch repair endonuclease MutL, partial [Polyangiales bacterium]|nr:DNA mismatch repair endonuclease MutL [Polyangiales bacterium]
MPSVIHILPEALADQIAAGEVVERPASVVKELVENAIDAGASRISVEIRDGGQQSIRVADDGCGMSRQDAELCVQRHATSKIRSRDDLFSISTLGFRGEALPSIASVSRFSLKTRPREDVAGTHVQVEGGQRAPLAEIGCAPGTLIEVSDLFYNVPARLKFLKAKQTESAHVAATCLRIALGFPAVAITLSRDGRMSQEFARVEHAHERVAAAFPDEPLRHYEAEFEGVRMSASLGAPERARSGASQLHVLVNRRPVRDMALSRCVAYAYGSVLPPGRFPVGALFLELDPHELDVNVHPQKLEVRFARGRALYDGLTRALARKLGTSAWSGPAARGANYWSSRLQPGASDGPQPAAAEPAGDPWGLGSDRASGPASAAAESADDPYAAGARARQGSAAEAERVAEPSPLLGARG